MLTCQQTNSMRIPHTQLSPATLRAVVQEFVTRDGTDHSPIERRVENVGSYSVQRIVGWTFGFLLVLVAPILMAVVGKMSLISGSRHPVGALFGFFAAALIGVVFTCMGMFMIKTTKDDG